MITKILMSTVLMFGVNTMAQSTKERMETLNPKITAAAALTGQDRDTMRAMVFVESGGDPDAENKETHALGLAQLTRIAVADVLKLEVWPNGLVWDQVFHTVATDPDLALVFMGLYLKKLRDHYCVDLIEGYNVGPTNWKRGFRNPRYIGRVISYRTEHEGRW